MGNIRDTEDRRHQNRDTFCDPEETYKPDLALFAKRLEAMRNRRGINRKALGELCGLSKNIIGKYERGEREPTAASLIRLADFFEVPVDYLLGRQKKL